MPGLHSPTGASGESHKLQGSPTRPSLAMLDTSPSYWSDSSRRGEFVFPMASAVSVAPPLPQWTKATATPNGKTSGSMHQDSATLIPGTPTEVVEKEHESFSRTVGATSSAGNPIQPTIRSASVSGDPSQQSVSGSLLISNSSTRPLPAFDIGNNSTSFEDLHASQDPSPPDVSAWMGKIDAVGGAGRPVEEVDSFAGKVNETRSNFTGLSMETSATDMSHTLSNLPGQSLSAISLSGAGKSRARQADAQGRLDALLLTSRFQHVQTPEGNMILDGRSARLLRCEDEPIHAPGAVQGFGVLVAFQEKEEGKLQVQLVSENSQTILGLTPNYLFGLESFSDCLDEEQADILWSNLEVAEDMTGDELADSGPQLFQLRIPDHADESGVRSARTCYAALHRAPYPPSATDEQTPTLILELELVDDHINPLQRASPGGAPESMLARPLRRQESTSLANTVNTSESHLALSRVSSPEQKVPSPPASDRDGANVSLPPVTEASEPSGVVEEEESDDDQQPYVPTEEQVLQSTISGAKPLRGLASPSVSKRLKPGRRTKRTKEVDPITILTQANEQLAAADDLSSCLRIAVGIVAEVTGYSRVMVYKFDPAFNGQVVTELVSWDDTHDLYLGLRFPASDIPPQARDLYRINRTRLLYDRDQPTARLVARSHAALAQPLDMTHCMLRAMSPIHLRYLKNMRVRASLSLSVLVFGRLWGLIALHNYGPHGKRLAFPLRRLCRLLTDSISQNVERLSLAARLKNRRELLGMTRPVEMNPSGYLSSGSEELFHLFRADFGVVSLGKEVKILGPLDASQEVLGLTEYLRLKRYTTILSTSNVTRTFTDMVLPCRLTTVAGVLLIPVSQTGSDFMCFMRKPQVKHVQWAGNPYKSDYRSHDNTEAEANAALEPRTSFKRWIQTIENESLEWGQDDLDAAETLSHIFGRFISIWRHQEQATQLTQLTSRLLSQARHDVRTPMHQILGFLEMTLDAPLDSETQEHIRRSYTASRSLLHTVNELLDLTRQSHEGEENNGSSIFSAAFDVVSLVADAVQLFGQEAQRRNMTLITDLSADTAWVVSDRSRMRQLIINVLSNAFKASASDTGVVEVKLRQLQQPADEESNPLPSCTSMYELLISDNGTGMPRAQLESIFRALEEVTTVDVYDTPPPSAESSDLKAATAELRQGVEKEAEGVGVGLAVVARTVKLLNGQLRVESVENEGTTFAFRFPLMLSNRTQHKASSSMSSPSPAMLVSRQPTLAQLNHDRVSTDSPAAAGIVIDSHRFKLQAGSKASTLRSTSPKAMERMAQDALLTGVSAPAEPSGAPVDPRAPRKFPKRPNFAARRASATGIHRLSNTDKSSSKKKKKSVVPLRVLIVDDNPVNRTILKKRLVMDGHKEVMEANDGQQAVEVCASDTGIDVVLMDLQMPILDGQGSTRAIRLLETQLAGVGPDGSPVAARRVPILAVSATLEEYMRPQLTQDGLDGWLTKPVNFARLRDLLSCVVPVESSAIPPWDTKYEFQPGGLDVGGWFGPILR